MTGDKEGEEQRLPTVNKRVPAEMVFVCLSALHTSSSHAEQHAQSGIASLSVSLPLTK